jgi:hypothetical protein
MAKFFFWLGIVLFAILFVEECILGNDEFFFNNLEKVPNWIDGICFFGGTLSLAISGIIVLVHWLFPPRHEEKLLYSKRHKHLSESAWWGKEL